MEAMYRPAAIDDCPEVAELINIASGGVLDFLYHDLVPGKTPVQILSEFLRETGGYYNHTNAVVAEIDGNICGAVLSYSSEFHGLNSAMEVFFPADRLEHLRDIFVSRVHDSLYIDALAVHENFRRKKIARRLLSLSSEKARGMGLSALSLIAFADNLPARELYKKFGFTDEKKIRIENHDLIHHRGGAFLMKCTL